MTSRIDEIEADLRLLPDDEVVGLTKEAGEYLLAIAKVAEEILAEFREAPDHDGYDIAALLDRLEKTLDKQD